MSGEVIVGLRFNPKDLGKLQDQAERFAADGTHSGMISLLKRAAAATALGDPLILYTAAVAEVHVLAEGFTAYGITQPTIEEVRL